MKNGLWEKAAELILKHEGGKTVDHAGFTNMGITLGFLQSSSSIDADADGYYDGDYDRDGDIDYQDIDQMTVEQVLSLYKSEFWDKYDYGALHPIDSVSLKVFDLAVNVGPKQAHKFLQRAARACGKPLVDDGLLGPITRRSVNGIAGVRLVSAMNSEAAGFYRLICVKNPNYKKFLNGWLNRAYAV